MDVEIPSGSSMIAATNGDTALVTGNDAVETLPTLSYKAQLRKLSAWLREIELWLFQHKTLPQASRRGVAGSSVHDVDPEVSLENLQLLLGQYQNIQASIENYGTHLTATREQIQHHAASSSTTTAAARCSKNNTQALEQLQHHHVPAAWAVKSSNKSSSALHENEEEEVITGHHEKVLINLIAPDNKSVRKEEEQEAQAVQSRNNHQAVGSTPAAGCRLTLGNGGFKADDRNQISARHEKCLQRLERRWQQAWIACVERQYQLQDVIAQKLNRRSNEINSLQGNLSNFYNTVNDIDDLQPPSKCKRVHSPNNIQCIAAAAPRPARKQAANDLNSFRFLPLNRKTPAASNITSLPSFSDAGRLLIKTTIPSALLTKSSSFHSLRDKKNQNFPCSDLRNKKRFSKSTNCRMDNEYLPPPATTDGGIRSVEQMKTDVGVPAAAAVAGGGANVRRHARRRAANGSGRRSSDDGLDFGYSSDSSSSQLSSRDDAHKINWPHCANIDNGAECSASVANPVSEDQLDGCAGSKNSNGKTKKFLSTIARSLTSENYHHVYSSSLRTPNVRYYSLPSAFSDSELFPNCRASTSFYYSNSMRFGPATALTEKADLLRLQPAIVNTGDRRRVSSASSVAAQWNRLEATPGKGYYQVTWQHESNSSGSKCGGRMKRWRDWCNKLAFSEEEWSDSEQRRSDTVEGEQSLPTAAEANDCLNREYASSSSSNSFASAATAFDTCTEEISFSDVPPSTRNMRSTADEMQQSHMQILRSPATTSSLTLLTPIATAKRKRRRRRRHNSKSQNAEVRENFSSASKQIESNEESAHTDSSSSSGSDGESRTAAEKTNNSFWSFGAAKVVVKSRSYHNEFASIDRCKEQIQLDSNEEENDDNASVVAPLAENSRGQRPSTLSGLGVRRRHASSSLALMSPPECSGEAPLLRRNNRKRNNSNRPRSWCITNNSSLQSHAKLFDVLPELDSAVSQATLVNGGNSDDENVFLSDKTEKHNIMMTPVTPPRTDHSTKLQLNRKLSNASSTTDDNTLQAESAPRKPAACVSGHQSDTSSVETSDQFWDDYQAAPYASDVTSQNSNAEDADEAEFSSGEEGVRATRLRRLINFGENYDEYLGSGAECCYDSSTSSKSGGRQRESSSNNENGENVKTLKRRSQQKLQRNSTVVAADVHDEKLTQLLVGSRSKLATTTAENLIEIDDKRLAEIAEQCAEQIKALSDFQTSDVHDRQIIEKLVRKWHAVQAQVDERRETIAAVQRAREILTQARVASHAVSARFGSGAAACRTPDASPGIWFGSSETCCEASSPDFVESTGITADENSSKSGRDDENQQSDDVTTFKQTPPPPTQLEISRETSFFDAAHSLLTDCSAAIKSLVAARKQVEDSLQALRSGHGTQSSSQIENCRNVNQNSAGIVKLLTIIDARLTAQLDGLQRVADECGALQSTVNRQAQVLVLLETDLAAIDAAVNDFGGKANRDLFAENNDLADNLADIERINANVEQLRGDMACLASQWSQSSSLKCAVDQKQQSTAVVVVLRAHAARELRGLLKEASKVQRQSRKLLQRATSTNLPCSISVDDGTELSVERERVVNVQHKKNTWFRRAMLYAMPFQALFTIGLFMYFVIDEPLLTPKCCSNSLYKSSLGGLFFPTLQYLYSGDAEMPPV